MRLRKSLGFAVLLVCLLAPASAWTSEPEPDENGVPESSIARALPDGGDPHGVRRRLYQRGVFFTLNYTADALGNLRGGLRRGLVGRGCWKPSSGSIWRSWPG